VIHASDPIVSQPLFGPSTRRYATAQDEGIRFNLILRAPEGRSKEGHREQKEGLQKR